MVQDYVDVAIKQHKLPSGFKNTVADWYTPLASAVAKLAQTAAKPIVLGVQGTQGSGKSTLADFLTLLLGYEHQLNAVSLSIDDFYLTRAERATLATDVHPLFATRGVPGTHDTQLALSTIEHLKQLLPANTLPIPRFNKAIDDRAPEDQWPMQAGPLHVVILEGWCVGLTPQNSEALQTPVNELEAQEDAQGIWRSYVNNLLANQYQTLFNELDALAVLKAPSFACVYEWRLLQEQKLAESLTHASAEARSKLLSPEQVKRFISHYQRLTEHGLETLPAQADWVLELDADHKITRMTSRSSHE